MMNGGRRGGRESGSLLVIIMIGVAVTSIALGAATQAWRTTWRRDSEEELIFRANQYVDGIVAYRREHAGQFPLDLEVLAKQGPRRLRYIRKLYKDPIAKDGKWGLLYLMPGGQGVYDAKAAQKAQDKAKSDWSNWDDAGTAGASPVGVTPLAQGTAGLPGAEGPVPGALPAAGAMPAGAMPLPPPMPEGQGGLDDKERVSEPPIGWPIVGVISRATGKLATDTYRVYKGHDHVDEWQFHVFDRGEALQGVPNAGATGPTPPAFIGPGFGGKGPITGIGGGFRIERNRRWTGRDDTPWRPDRGGGRGRNNRGDGQSDQGDRGGKDGQDEEDQPRQ
jgi:hypothetical protein